MSSDISPSLVNWMTSMMTMRLQVILEHIPITQEQIQNYIVHTQVTFIFEHLHYISAQYLWFPPRVWMDTLPVGGNQTCKPHLHDITAQAWGCQLHSQVFPNCVSVIWDLRFFTEERNAEEAICLIWWLWHILLLWTARLKWLINIRWHSFTERSVFCNWHTRAWTSTKCNGKHGVSLMSF